MRTLSTRFRAVAAHPTEHTPPPHLPPVPTLRDTFNALKSLTRPQARAQRSNQLLASMETCTNNRTHLISATTSEQAMTALVAKAPGMSSLRQPCAESQATQQRFIQVVQEALPSTHPSSSVLSTSSQLHSVGPPAQCLQELALRFQGNGTAELFEALMAMPPDPALEGRGYNHTVRLATGLLQVSRGDAALALEILREVTRDPSDGAAPSADIRAQAHALRCSLAQTATGMDALARIDAQGPTSTDPRIRDARQSQLQICGWLASQPGGMPPGQHVGEVAAFTHHARQQLYIDQGVGADTDAPCQLAHQALLATEALLAGQAPTAVQRHALLAWENGYQTSGRDERGRRQPFNQFLHRLGKIRSYYERATKYSRAAPWKRPLIALVRAVQTMFGKNKALLETVVSQGTQGAAMSMMNIAGAQFRTDLRGVMADMHDDLRDRRLHPRYDADRTRNVIRMALLELWSEVAAKDVRLTDQAILARCQQLNPSFEVDSVEVRRTLREIVPHSGRARQSMRLKLKHLERMARDLYLPAGAQDLRKVPVNTIHERIQALSGQVPDLEINIQTSETQVANLRARLRSSAGNAHTAAELRNADQVLAGHRRTLQAVQGELRYAELMVRINRLRYIANGEQLAKQDQPGLFPTVELIRSTLEALAGADNALHTQVGMKAGVSTDVGPVFQLMSKGLVKPIVGPTVEFSYGRGVNLSSGTVAAGYKFELGRLADTTQGTLGVSLGAKLGWDHAGITGIGGAGKTWLRTAKAGEIASLTASRNHPTWQADAQQINLFLRQIMEAPQAYSPAELWSIFADMFPNKTVSASFVTDAPRMEGCRLKGQLGATAGDSHFQVGPQFLLNQDRTSSVFKRVATKGSTQLTNLKMGPIKTTAAGFTLAVKNPVNQSIAPDAGIGGKPLAIAGTMLSSTHINGTVSLHLGQENGRVVPSLTYRDTFFSDVESLAAHLNTRREVWNRICEYKGHDGQAWRGQEAVDQFLKEAAALPLGEFVFYERGVLKDAVAQLIDTLSDEATALAQCPVLSPELAQRLQDIEHLRQHLYAQPESWNPKLLLASEGKRKGSTYGVKLVGELQAFKLTESLGKTLKATVGPLPTAT